jgi:hypothetical protein
MKIVVLVKHVSEPAAAWRREQEGFNGPVLDDDRRVILRIEDSRSVALPAELPAAIRWRPCWPMVGERR